jgi:hypothetical protein
MALLSGGILERNFSPNTKQDMRTETSTNHFTPPAAKPLLADSAIVKFLLKSGFQKIRHPRIEEERYQRESRDYDYSIRIGEIHWLFWSELHSRFAIGVKNEKKERERWGVIISWKYILLPKSIKSVSDAKKVLEALC